MNSSAHLTMLLWKLYEKTYVKLKSNILTHSILSTHIITPWHTTKWYPDVIPANKTQNHPSVPGMVLKADKVYLAQPPQGSDIWVEQFCHLFLPGTHSFTIGLLYHQVISLSQCTNQSLWWSLPDENMLLSNLKGILPSEESECI